MCVPRVCTYVEVSSVSSVNRTWRIAPAHAKWKVWASQNLFRFRQGWNPAAKALWTEWCGPPYLTSLQAAGWCRGSVAVSRRTSWGVTSPRQTRSRALCHPSLVACKGSNHRADTLYLNWLFQIQSIKQNNSSKRSKPVAWNSAVSLSGRTLFLLGWFRWLSWLAFLLWLGFVVLVLFLFLVLFFFLFLFLWFTYRGLRKSG